MEPNEALQEFATAPTVQGRFQAVLVLAKGRRLLHRSIKTAEFEKGLIALASAAMGAVDDYERLLAVVALSRVRAIAKSIRGRIDENLATGLERPLPSITLLSNPDDRFYVAQACGVAWHEWMSDYLADAVVREEAAEKARTECVRSLLAHSPSIEEVVERIANKFTGWSPGTESPGDSVARRLRRIFAAMRPSLREYTGKVSIEIGQAVVNLIRTAFSATDRPSTKSVIDELTEEIAGLVHDLIRVRFSLATERTTFDAIRACSSWFPQHRWPHFAKSSKSVQLLVQDTVEGISLLARQGITDAGLLACLSILSGSREEADLAAEKLAASLPNLDTGVREWLASGGTLIEKLPLRRSELADESQANAENVVLADLLVDTERILALAKIIETDVLPEIRMLSPKQAEPLERHLGQEKALGDAIRAFAARRKLRIREQPDAIVEFSPLDHELVGDAPHGVRQVRVIRPVVEQVREGQIPFVIRKGLVEGV